jgi:hypothetical protein
VEHAQPFMPQPQLLLPMHGAGHSPGYVFHQRHYLVAGCSRANGLHIRQGHTLRVGFAVIIL